MNVRSIRSTVQGGSTMSAICRSALGCSITGVVVLQASLAGGLSGQTINLDTLSLFELPGVMVQIEGGRGGEEHGLFVDSLRRDIEGVLRDAGIGVFDEDEWQVTIGNPLLLVSIDLIHPSDFFYLYNLEVELQQLVVLARDSTIPAFSATWSAQDVTGTLSSGSLPTLRTQVLAQVDHFISAVAVADRRYRGRWFVQRERSGNVDGSAVESSSNNVRGSTEIEP